ncbi:MAG: hypothetical protein ACLUZZ_04500 [Alistipes inops]
MTENLTTTGPGSISRSGSGVLLELARVPCMPFNDDQSIDGGRRLRSRSVCRGKSVPARMAVAGYAGYWPGQYGSWVMYIEEGELVKEARGFRYRDSYA